MFPAPTNFNLSVSRKHWHIYKREPINPYTSSQQLDSKA